MSNLIVLNEKNEDVYDRLVVSLEAGLGTLQILIAVCDNSALKQEVIRRYESELEAEGVRIYRLALNPDEPSLLQALIDGKIEKNQQAIATVLGAEKLNYLGASNREKLDSFLGYLQWTREALRGYPLPIVLWLPSALLVEIVKKAPDFWSWRSGGTFTFHQEAQNFISINSERTFPLEQAISVNRINSVLSIEQLESSLAQALATWDEDNPNIEPIYALLGRAYVELILHGEISEHIKEVKLAETYLVKAISLQKRYDHKVDLANSLVNLGYLYSLLKEFNFSESLYLQSLSISEMLGDRIGIATVLGLLGDVMRQQGKWQIAKDYFRNSLQIFEELRDSKGIATSLASLGGLEWRQNNWDAAEANFRDSLQIFRELNDDKDIASVLGLLGGIERNRGNLDAAKSLYGQSLKLHEELGDSYKSAINLSDFALLEKQRGNLTLAQQYYDQAKTIYQQLGAVKDLERIETEWNS